MQMLTWPKRFPVYLWMVGVYPILHLFAANFGMVHEYHVAQTIAVMLIVTSLAYFAGGRLIENPHKAAFFLSLASLYFSTSGHLYTMFVLPRSLLVWTIASAIIVTAIALGCARFIPQHSYAHFTPPFNLIAGALLTLQIVVLLAAANAAQRYVDANSAFFAARANRPGAVKVMDGADRPDIYYIIPDGYPSDARLLTDMNFDNSEFTEALRERGFTIAPHAQSNYGSTYHSLAATLNMRYFKTNPTELNDIDYLKLSMVHSRAADELLRLGYTYVQFVSGYVVASPIADINRDFAPGGPIEIQVDDTVLSTSSMPDRQAEHAQTTSDTATFRQPFTPLYIDTTLLRIVRSQLEKLRLSEQLVPFHGDDAQRFLDTIDEIGTIAAMPEATFTIVHLMQPHLPINFNANGDIIAQSRKPSHAQFYADLRYSNSQFLRMIDTILQDSTNAPIIVFQADHGSIFGRVWTTENRLTHFDIYAAYYLPEDFDLETPQPYTMVNSFTLIFNEVFDFGLDWQEDRLYDVWKGYDAPFDQVDVTAEFLHR